MAGRQPAHSDWLSGPGLGERTCHSVGGCGFDIDIDVAPACGGICVGFRRTERRRGRRPAGRTGCVAEGCGGRGRGGPGPCGRMGCGQCRPRLSPSSPRRSPALPAGPVSALLLPAGLCGPGVSAAAVGAPGARAGARRWVRRWRPELRRPGPRPAPLGRRVADGAQPRRERARPPRQIIKQVRGSLRASVSSSAEWVKQLAPHSVWWGPAGATATGQKVRQVGAGFWVLASAPALHIPTRDGHAGPSRPLQDLVASRG